MFYARRQIYVMQKCGVVRFVNVKLCNEWQVFCTFQSLHRRKCFATYALAYTGLFKMIVGVLTTCHTPRFPDATPCDFFLWGYVKDQVCVPPLPACIPELKVVTYYKQFERTRLSC